MSNSVIITFKPKAENCLMASSVSASGGLSVRQAEQLAKRDRRPVFAELDLVSSHYRWGTLPDLVDWKDVGDGSVFTPMAARGSSVDGRRDPRTSARLYGESVEYTWRVILSFLTTYPDRNRVVIVAGDHQPHAFVGGVGSNRDAPVTIAT